MKNWLVEGAGVGRRDGTKTGLSGGCGGAAGFDLAVTGPGGPPTASLLTWTPPSPTQNEKWGPMQPGHGLWSHLHLADLHGGFLNGFGAPLASPSGPHSVNELLFFQCWCVDAKQPLTN